MTLHAVPKPSAPLVSAKLRQSARGRACTLRWACDGTDVVLCHIRGVWSGVGQKPNDIHAFFGCGGCNKSTDSADRPPAKELLRAMIETHQAWLDEGLLKIGDRR